MAIVKWNRWGIPTVFDDENWLSPWSDQSSSPSGIDIYETENAVIVEAQIPGIKEENVEVNIEGNVLTINAYQEETDEQKNEKKTVYKSTRQTSFNYSTNLPRIVNPSKAEAELEEGVLKITIPKTEEDKAKENRGKKEN